MTFKKKQKIGKLLFFILFFILTLSQTFSEEIEEKDLWRYDLEKAIIHALNKENLSQVSDLATRLKAENIQESIWNILKWEEENIVYDFDKANLPAPIIQIWSTGKIEVIQGEKNIFQTPLEIIKSGKGVCKDYAILTAGLLLNMDYSPVYILDIEFQDDPIRHTAVGVIIDGWLFILDQNPPPMDPGTYYRHWLYNEGKVIKKIIAYEINKDSYDFPKKYNINIEEFKNQDFEVTKEFLNYISLSLMKIFVEKFPNLNIDIKIANLEKSNSLPRGYLKGKVYFFGFPDFLENYNPIFHSQFIKELFKKMLKNTLIIEDLRNYKFFYIKSEKEDKDMSIILNLAL